MVPYGPQLGRIPIAWREPSTNSLSMIHFTDLRDIHGPFQQSASLAIRGAAFSEKPNRRAIHGPSDRSAFLQDRIAQAIERQKVRLGERVKHSLDEERSVLRRAPGSQQREFYERYQR